MRPCEAARSWAPLAAPAPEHGFTGSTIQRNRYSVFQKQPGGHHRVQFYTSISPATAPGQGSALRLGPHPPPIPPSPQGADKVPFRLLPPFPLTGGASLRSSQSGSDLGTHFCEGGRWAAIMVGLPLSVAYTERFERLWKIMRHFFIISLALVRP